ncbi:Pr6Pr family membrane protein [Pedobacter sp. PWIIR3]
MKHQIRFTYTLLNALMLWFALILQFYISTGLYLDEGRSFAGSLTQIISYFTIQTNLVLAISLTSISLAPNTIWGRFFNKPSVQTALAVYIIVVGLIYAVLLKGIFKLEGWFIVADFILHTVSPLTYLFYWVIFVPKTKIKWSSLLPWAIFPLLYLFYCLIRGAISGYYPYPFIDVSKFGYGQVMINSVGVTVLFLVLSSILIGISRMIDKN